MVVEAITIIVMEMMIPSSDLLDEQQQPQDVHYLHRHHHRVPEEDLVASFQDYQAYCRVILENYFKMY